jgi:hypothetical protein
MSVELFTLPPEETSKTSNHNALNLPTEEKQFGAYKSLTSSPDSKYILLQVKLKNTTKLTIY